MIQDMTVTWLEEDLLITNTTYLVLWTSLGTDASWDRNVDLALVMSALPVTQ
jgi:hypothetical protein